MKIINLFLLILLISGSVGYIIEHSNHEFNKQGKKDTEKLIPNPEGNIISNFSGISIGTVFQKINKATLPTSQIETFGIGISSFSPPNWTQILDTLGISWLHAQGYDGDNVNVGMIDNGVDLTQSEFVNKTIVQQNFETTFGSSSKTHGTPVSGAIIGGTSITGAAPHAALYSAEMGSNAADSVILGNFTNAMQWLASNNVSIINTSFGGIANWTGLIDIAKSNNIVLVGSAGNDGTNLPTSGPGADPYSIGVGAYDPSLNETYSFSSRGPTSRYYQKPDIVVNGYIPSINVVSGLGEYLGTSFSSPLVVGGIASVIEGLQKNNVTWNPENLKTALLQSAKPVRGLDNNGYGQGLVNFTRMFEILTSKQDQGIILSGLPDEYSTIYQNMDEVIPIQIIRDENVTISITGNISNIISTNSGDIYFPLFLSTNDTISGYLDGIVELRNSTLDIIDSQYVKIIVEGPFKGKIGFDFYHNNDFVSGQTNLLNRDNQLAKVLRNSGYWPIYINSALTTKITQNIDLLFFNNYMDVTNQDEFVTKYMSNKELTVLDNFLKSGGNVLFSSKLVDHSTKDELTEFEKISSLGSINLDRSTNQFVTSQSELINETVIGRYQYSLTMTGLPLLHGQNLRLYDNYIQFANISTGKHLIVMTDTTENTGNGNEFLLQIMNTINQPRLELTSMARVGNKLQIKITAEDLAQFDSATHDSFDFGENLVSKNLVTIRYSITNSLIILNITLQQGLHNMILTSSNNSISNYIQLSYNFNRWYRDYLIYDVEKPSIADYPTVPLILNQSTLITGYNFSLLVKDNYLIDQIVVTQDGNAIPYNYDPRTDQLNFTIRITRNYFMPSFNVTLSILDKATNLESVFFTVNVIYDQNNTTNTSDVITDQSNQNSFSQSIFESEINLWMPVFVTVGVFAVVYSIYLYLKSNGKHV